MFSTVIALSLVSLVSANSFAGLSIGQQNNWGCASSKAPSTARNQCSGAGSFFTPFGGSALCCSSSTKVPPTGGLTCPFDWVMHKDAKCCIPPTEVSKCDCGEGFTWNAQANKCVKTPNKCSGSQWYHDRSSSCCDNSWEHNPPKGNCPGGISCPNGWFWHKDHKVCKPLTPRAPEPDCHNWDHKKRLECCGSGSNPSPGSHNGHGHGWKRNLSRQQTAFPQTNLDRMYCPGVLHACSVATESGEWSYECLDVATELESCGGCSSTGEGQDCTTIPHAVSVGCNVGVCEVFTCQSGFKPNGTSCIPS